MRIQPDEGVTLRFGAKVPGQAFMVRDVLMDFSYGAAFLEESPDAYERLLLDAMVGDPTLFIRSDEVDAAWRIVQPLLDAWRATPPPWPGTLLGPGARPGRHPHRARWAAMADTVVEMPLAIETWERSRVSLGEVVAALPELRRQAAGRDAGTRTAVMTIVMVIGPDDDPEATAAPVRSLGPIILAGRCCCAPTLTAPRS